MAAGARAPAITMPRIVCYFFGLTVFLVFLAAAGAGSPISSCMANSVNWSEIRISDFETVDSCFVNRLISIDPPRIWV